LNCSDGVTFFCFSLCNWQHTMLLLSFYPGHRCECHVSGPKNPDSVFAKLLWNTKITSLETNTQKLAYNEAAPKQTEIVCFGVDLFMVQGRFSVTCIHTRGGTYQKRIFDFWISVIYMHRDLNMVEWFIKIYYILSSNNGIFVWPIWPEVNCPYFHTPGK
jgi:hypothetical protein